MPLIESSTYKAPFLFKNAHIQTMFPSTFIKIKGIQYQRERIDLPDSDFIDLDWSKVGCDKLMIGFMKMVAICTSTSISIGSPYSLLS